MKTRTGLFWGRGWIRITFDRFMGPPETYWFFDPRSGLKGGVVCILLLFAVVAAFVLATGLVGR